MPYALRAKGMTVYYFAISSSFIFNQYVTLRSIFGAINIIHLRYANPIALQQYVPYLVSVVCVSTSLLWIG